MAKKQYISPVLASLTPDPDPEIPFGGSQGTSGEDSPYSFSGISDDILDLIYANCDDIDLADMDANGDLEITYDEYLAWYQKNQPW